VPSAAADSATIGWLAPGGGGAVDVAVWAQPGAALNATTTASAAAFLIDIGRSKIIIKWSKFARVMRRDPLDLQLTSGTYHG